jgi:hypothetical protein
MRPKSVANTSGTRLKSARDTKEKSTATKDIEISAQRVA